MKKFTTLEEVKEKYPLDLIVFQIQNHRQELLDISVTANSITQCITINLKVIKFWRKMNELRC